MAVKRPVESAEGAGMIRDRRGPSRSKLGELRVTLPIGSAP